MYRFGDFRFRRSRSRRVHLERVVHLDGRGRVLVYGRDAHRAGIPHFRAIERADLPRDVDHAAGHDVDPGPCDLDLLHGRGEFQPHSRSAIAMPVEEGRQEAVGRRVVLTYVRHFLGRVLSNSRVADGPGRDVLHGLRGLQRHQKDAVGPRPLNIKIVAPLLARRRPRRPRRAAVREVLGPDVVIQVHGRPRLGLGHLGPAAHAVGVRVRGQEAGLAPRVRVEARRGPVPVLAVLDRFQNLLVGDHVPPVVLIVRVERLRRESPLLVLDKPMKEALELVVVGILCEVVLIRLATHRLAGLAVLAGERQRAGVALDPALEHAIRDFVGSRSSRVGQVVHDVDRVEVREVRVDAVDSDTEI
mmetsp:Transcript_11600/g.30299  ORF Transcript_11600/g.30299 Transcript_11600/m.30299 type:complete len:359 (-) Transcript_11600:873-1949(-)